MIRIFLCLMVEFLVQDIDCMPLNPLDNMPEALRRQIGARKASFMIKEPQINGNSNFGGCEMHFSPMKVHASSALVMHGKVRLLGSINVLIFHLTLMLAFLFYTFLVYPTL